MEVNYTMQKMNDLNQEGNTLLIPKIVLKGQCSIRSLAKEMEKYSTFNRSEIMGILTLLGEIMTAKMASGYSVKLDEIGTFTPALAFEKNRKGETANPEKTNARHIGISNILFRPSKDFILNTAVQCKLKKGPQCYGCLPAKHTPEERLQIVREYLRTHDILTVKDYEKIAGIRHTQATIELKEWSRTEGSGIISHGKGSHKVYLREKE